MIVSYKWIKEYFEKDLPQPEKLIEEISLKAFEIEKAEKINEEDWSIEVDVLPNRSHDCLSHDGIAKEISVLTGIPLKQRKIDNVAGDFKSDYNITINHPESCYRYLAREIKNVKVEESPKELREKLESLGQRSINNIVDITNIVMYQTGQPMHAFDENKLEGQKILIRKAQAGEEIMTLDNNHVILDEDSLIIADEKDPLAIAGIKGGKKAEVGFETKNIVLESANFNSTEIRKTSRRLGVATDSSKRFENKITPELANDAMNLATEMILKYASSTDIKISEKIDLYDKPWKSYRTGVSLSEINSLLGVNFSEKDVFGAFEKLNFNFDLVAPREIIFKRSQELLNKVYKYGASVSFDAPEEFDCSSFVAYVYSFAGFSIPRMTVDQYVFSNRIEKENLKIGDLVFANTGLTKNPIHFKSLEFLPGTEVSSGIDHVAIYLGEGKIIHATGQGGVGVVIEKLAESERFKNTIGFGSILNSEEKRFAVQIPSERLDLRTGPDLIEEVARVIGYDKIVDKKIEIENFKPKINKQYQLNTSIRKILSEIGFSEVITYVFCDKGEIELEKPISEDKKYLRSSLEWGMNSSFEKNLNNMDLLGLDFLKIFEIGKVFSYEKEKEILSIGVMNKNGIKKPKVSEILEKAIKTLEEKLNLKINLQITSETKVLEIDLEQLGENFEAGKVYEKLPFLSENVKYRPISPYPFMLRDIAVWLPKKFSSEDILEIIKEQAGDLLVRSSLFDVYEKEEKISYALHLVFQSKEKTLTDDEINEIMKKITEIINSKEGWEVR